MLPSFLKKIPRSCTVLVALLFIGITAQCQDFDKKALEKQLKSLSPKEQKKFIDSVSTAFSQQEIAAGIDYLNFCVDYAWRKKFDNARIGSYFYRRASLYRKIGEYAKALSDYGRAESIFFEEKNNAGLQSVYSGYAGLYSRIGEHVKAIKYIHMALDKAEMNKDLDAKGVCYNDLGNVYRHIKLYDSAIHFFNKSREIYIKTDGDYQAALILDNISMVFSEQNMLDSAAYYNDMAFELARPQKNTFLELQLLFSVCGISEKRGNFETQLSASLRAKFLADSLNIPFYQMMCDGNYAVALKNNGRYKEALEIFRKIKAPMVATGDLSMAENFYGEMSAIFSELGQPDSALVYFKASAALKDSIDKTAEMDRVNEIVARFNLEEKEKSIKHLQKQKSAEEEKSKLKSIIIWVAAGMMAVVLVLLIIVIQRFRENRKLNREITRKNSDLAEKQKEILDSINYARKIQYALLAHDDLLKQNLPEHFVFFKPKDIVSGDFYWGTVGVPGSKFQVPTGEAISNSFYLAVCDSTGHGVPGAFMSLLNISFLNEAINEKGIEAPNEVFNHVRKRLIENVSHEGAQDGMDATLIKFEIGDSTFEIQYAAAHHSPVVVRDGKLIELPFDKMPIGKGESTANFMHQTFQVQTGDVIYLYTDGFADQFGGPKGKKFKESNLHKLMIEIHHKTMHEQKNILQQSLDTWKGNLEQVDDICIIGIRIGRG